MQVLPPRYTSVRAVAHGGMGEIYLATDSSLGRDVAVKVLAERFAADSALRARFTREALAAARLSGQPNIVTIYDVGEWGGRPYIVMEYVPGGTVADRLSSGGVAAAAALRWIEQAARALDAAHGRGVVHRDVKPANLLLAHDDTIRVADFGIASAAGLTALTATGTVLGTIGYLAPEQAAGNTAGPAADRYALAVVAYELLAGRRPFDREAGAAAEALAASREPLPPISSVGTHLPPTLDSVFARALARDPGRRYESAARFAHDLTRAFEAAAGTTAGSRAVTPAPQPRPDRRSRLPLVLLLLGLLGGAAAAGVLLLPGGSHDRAARTLSRQTVTLRGSTVTVTSPAPTTSAAPPPAGTAAPSASSGSTLNDEGYARMRAREFDAALPLLEQAVAKLRGTGTLAEAYASYNLAYTRFSLGRCDGVLDLLTRSQAIQGHRVEIDRLRARASTRC